MINQQKFVNHQKEHEKERTRRNKNIAILYAFAAIARF